jgi:hypothetical protein
MSWRDLGWSLHILEQNSRHDLGEPGLLGVERDSPGPKGLKNLAQGLSWVFCLMPNESMGDRKKSALAAQRSLVESSFADSCPSGITKLQPAYEE